MNFKDARIIYMGTPKISADTFEALINAGVHFVALIAQEDKEVGRKRIKVDVPTKVVAKKYNIPVYQPHKIREDYEFVKELKPDLILTFAYGQIIPKGLLDIPIKGCFNLHGSILPKYRGAAPIQRAIMNGETTTGITLMKMDVGMDTGDMYAKEVVNIDNDDNYTSLCNKLSLAATKITLDNLDKLLDGSLIGEKQDESQMTIASKILPNEEHIDINKSAVEQINQIRALSLTPGGYLYLDNEKIKILNAHVYKQENKYQLGELVSFNDAPLCYQAKDALINLVTIQPQGKNPMKASDYLNGHKNVIGKILK